MLEKIRSLLQQGEGLKIEFKEAQGGMPKSVYETVCAFSNTQGGEILLGVKDNGDVVGIAPHQISQLKKDFANTINNPAKNHPPLYLSIEPIVFEEKHILYINVPESAEVHRCCNKIFVRNEDGDYDITSQQAQVAALYLRKQTSYSENQIFKYARLDDLRQDLIAKARKMAVIRDANHPWKELDDFELLKSASLYKRDVQTGEEGITLAGLLLLGKDEVIASVLPHFKTDLIMRVKDIGRYDDRDDVRTNLIDSYDRIMAFVSKHLPSPFYLEGTTRLDIRNIIFREIAVNLLVHREYTNHYPAKLVIEKDRIFTENGNKPYIHGNINPEMNTPYPKNPTIARFFKEIGLADELGSGVRKITQYAEAYAGSQPILTDSDIFRLEWKTNLFQDMKSQEQDSSITVTDKASEQVSEQASEQASRQVSGQVSEQALQIITFCETPKSLSEIMTFSQYKSRGYFVDRVLQPLINQGLIERTFPNIPKHPNQKYKTKK